MDVLSGGENLVAGPRIVIASCLLPARISSPKPLASQLGVASPPVPLGQTLSQATPRVAGTLLYHPPRLGTDFRGTARENLLATSGPEQIFELTDLPSEVTLVLLSYRL